VAQWLKQWLSGLKPWLSGLKQWLNGLKPWLNDSMDSHTETHVSLPLRPKWFTDRIKNGIQLKWSNALKVPLPAHKVHGIIQLQYHMSTMAPSQQGRQFYLN